LKNCRDPRDKLFGIHSLLPASLQQRIAIDYSLSVADVFASTTQAIIENDNVIYIITYIAVETAAAGETNAFFKTPAVPSWAVNWAGNVLVPISECVRGFNANGNVKPFFKFCHLNLEVRGVRLGITGYVQGMDWHGGDPPNTSLRLISLVDQVRNLLKNFLKVRPVDKSTYALTSLSGALKYPNNQPELSVSSSFEKLLYCEPGGDISDNEDRDMGENLQWLRDRAMFFLCQYLLRLLMRVEQTRTYPSRNVLGLARQACKKGTSSLS
jgi:hypothetical protein